MRHEWYKNILLTGKPWCGKSTLLQELVATVDHKTGFITQEIRDDTQQRIWFEVISLWGERASIASKTEKSDILFAEKYWIQTEWMKELIANLNFEIWDILYLDEIAPMQLYAPEFNGFVLWRLSSPNPLLWIIKLDDEKYPFIREIKQRKDVLLVNISQNIDPYNKEFLQKLVEKMKKSQKYIQEKERFIQKDSYTRTMNSSSAQRTLKTRNNDISCNCQFYIDYGICSHSMALRQLFPQLTR